MLYLGTGVMLSMALAVIFIIVSASIHMKKQRLFFEKRDSRWLERIEGVETLVKTEFKELLKHIKK